MRLSSLLARIGLMLLRKSADMGFTAQSAETIRKYFAIHPAIARSLGYSEPSYAGKSISEYTALNLSTVWRCVQVISQAEACLPLHVIEQTETGKRVADKHPLDWVLYRQPNPDMTSLRMRQTMMAHVLLWGNAYARIVKRGGTGQTIGLWPVPPDRVTPRLVAGERVYEVARQAETPEIVPASEMFHLPGLGFDGLQGYSVVSMAKQSLGLAAVQDEYAAKFFAKGGRKPYYLGKKTRFKTDQEFEEFRAKWEETYASSDGFHKAPILEGDIELHELGMPLEDAQLLASRKFSVPDICRWFGVQPHKAFDLERSTFSNIEHQGLEFIQQTLMYWLCLWEQEAEAQLLTEGEQGRYYIKHNLTALQRADFESRMRGYATGLQNGFMNPDQVCQLEDWDPLPNGAGKAYHIQLNMQTLKDPLFSETKQESQGGDDGPAN